MVSTRLPGLSHRLWFLLVLFLLIGVLLATCAADPGVRAKIPNGFRASDLTIYDDELAANWQNWSWQTTVDLAATAVVHAGNRSLSARYNAAWAGLSLYSPVPIDTADYAAIDFWLYGGPGGAAIDVSTQPSGEGDTSPAKSITGPAGVWTHFTVPLTDLGSPAAIQRINFQERTGGTQPTFYMDDLRLVAKAAAGGFPDATADAQRAFVPGPSGVAIAPNGRVYVAVYQDNRVYSWPSVAGMTGGGVPDKTFGVANGNPDAGCTNGPSATILCGPESVAVDAAGNLYVTDTYHHRVVIFYNPDTDINGTEADNWLGQPNLTSGEANYDSVGGDGIVEGFCLPRGVAVDGDGAVYVADEWNHRILIFTDPINSDRLPDRVLGQGDFDDGVNVQCGTAFPLGSNAANRFYTPLGVAVDSAGQVYVADLFNSRVQRFAPPLIDGMDATKTFGGVDHPHDVAVDNSDNLYIADTRNNRVLVYRHPPTNDETSDHQFTGLSYPMGMAFTAAGDFVQANCGPNSLANPDNYPPCLTDPRDVRLFLAPAASPTSTPTATATGTNTPTATATGQSTTTATPTVTPTPTATTPADVTLAVDVQASRKPISPEIYGMNTYLMPGDATAYMQTLGVSVRRWGGNATSRYNWKLDVSNTAMDWYFENFKENGGNNLPDDSAVNRFVAQNVVAGTETFLTVPLIGFTAKDATSCGYSIAKYGQQQGNDWEWRPDCGNGRAPDGQILPPPNPLDTSNPITPSWVSEWIAYLTGRFGDAASGGIRFYNLDNEPDIWWETHRDVQPTGWKYQEFRDLTIAYAAAIRAADPAAQILGPVVNGWTYYWHGAYDAQRQDWVTPDDRNDNGGTPFVPWYLQQMKAYDDANAIRLLDYLDLHYYPQAGVALQPAGDAATQARRLRSTRSLWDPTYVDESWIADSGPDGGIVRLIPRMREWVATNYPGTKLAIGEYNWGGLEHINGALAQADVLGIFGREGVDLATLWEPPALDDPGAFAFRLYRNYDGAGGRFGDVSVAATSTDQDRLSIYAAERSSDDGLTIVVINKTGGPLTANLTIANRQSPSAAEVYRYSPANLAAIQHLTDQQMSNGSINAAFPANSITMFVLPPPSAGGENLFLPQISR